METRPIFVLVCLMAAAPALSEAYRWVDDDGVIHFSDRPREGAEVVHLSEYSRNTGARLYTDSNPASNDDDQQDADQPFAYQSIAITSPGSEQTLWNIEGVLNVSVSLTPGLQRGHQVRAYFDGQARMVSGTTFQIEEVWRGAHNIQVEIVDSTGKLMIRSDPTRFYVQQNSVIRGRR
jgi:hypothetical protein